MSGVQFNLLPDIKLDFIKAERTKKLVMSIATIVAGTAIAIFLIVLITVEGVQKKQLNNADNAISTAQSQLENTPGLADVVTVQNQLQALSNLHHEKHINSRLFSYLTALTPIDVNVGNLTLDMPTTTLQIIGCAASQEAVNTFIDTMKFTTYKVGLKDKDHMAFTSVVENSFGPDATCGTDYNLTVIFDANLFSNNLSAVPALTVPKLTTTRSALDDPNNALFNGQGTSTKKGVQ